MIIIKNDKYVCLLSEGGGVMRVCEGGVVIDVGRMGDGDLVLFWWMVGKRSWWKGGVDSFE